MRVAADLDLCQGHAMCELEAPAVFAYDRASNQVRVLAAQPPDDEHERVRKAVAYCPAMALTLTDD